MGLQKAQGSGAAGPPHGRRRAAALPLAGPIKFLVDQGDAPDKMSQRTEAAAEALLEMAYRPKSFGASALVGSPLPAS